MRGSDDIILDENLEEYTKAFMNASEEVKELPNKHFTCLGSFHTIGESLQFQEQFISLHIRPHLFLRIVQFPNNLGNMLKYRDTDVVRAPYIIFAFLECIRRYLIKDKVYWKVVNKEDRSFEIYV